MRNRGGFTLVETLIVLGVTGVLFFSVMSSISGKQGRTEFTQSIREIEARVRDTLNDVNNGFYPNVDHLACDVSDGTSAPTLSYNSSLVDTTGKNGNCIAAGKVVQYGTDSDVSATRIYSLAGRKSVTTGASTSDVGSIAELKPVVIKVNDSGHILDATERNVLPSGIQLVKSDGSDSHIAFGIYYQNFGGQSGGQSSGTSSVSIAKLNPGTYSEDDVITAAESVSQDSDFLPAAGSLLMCFKSATSNQFATITVKGSGGGFTTELAIDIKLNAAMPCV